MPERADLRAFLDAAGRLDGGARPGRFFGPDAPITVARAPGRLDLMGGIADYSGSLVLQWPLAVAAFAAVQAGEPASGLEVASFDPDTPTAPPRRFTVVGDRLRDLLRSDYAAVGEACAADPATSWAAYVVGVLAVLAREAGLPTGVGYRIAIGSAVPEGKGVSSSAALEVAVACGLLGAAGRVLEGDRLARLCQRAENFAVGAPCGIMDQMAVALGREGSLLALLCQPAEVRGHVPLPEGVAIWGIDSGIRHAVSGSDYTSVRVGAFIGYRMLAERAGLGPFRRGVDGVALVDDGRWGAYLANVDPAEFERDFEAELPESIVGAEFLDRFGATTDPVTRVEPGRAYAVRQPTAHPIREHARVRRFAELLATGATDDAILNELGALMYASHASYSACGLGSEGTDRLVELVRSAGPGAGLYGAKITGGGSGGTVAVLGRAGADAAIREVAQRYASETGRAPVIFAGSSPGAVAHGTRPVRRVGDRLEPVG